MASSRQLPTAYFEDTYGNTGTPDFRDYSVLATWEADSDVDQTTSTQQSGSSAASGNRGGDYLIGSKVTLTKATLTSIGINWGDTDPGSVRLGIYTDNGGVPDQLIVETGDTVIDTVTGWQDISITSTDIETGTYHLVYNMSINDGGENRKTIYNDAGGLGRHYVAAAYGAMPATFPAATANVVTHNLRVNHQVKAYVLTCYDDTEAEVDDSILMDGAISNSSYYRVLRAASGHRGTRTTGVRFTKTGTGDNRTIQLQEGYAQVHDIAAKANSSDNHAMGFDSRNAYTKFIGCTAYDCISTGSTKIGLGINGVNATGSISYINCYAYGCTGTHGQDAAFRYSGGTGHIVYNCTGTDSKAGFMMNSASGITKNCIWQNNTQNIYLLTSTNTETTNVSDDGVTFAADGYHLASADAGAIDQGTDLSSDGVFAFDDDIDGDTRGASWDIGADEYVTAGGGTFTMAGLDSTSSIENVVLGLQSGSFTIGDIDSLSSIENIVLDEAGGDFTIASLDSLSEIDNITIQFEGTFLIGEISCSSSIDEASLMGDFIVAELDSLSEIDNVVLELSGGDLFIDSLNSLSTIDEITLSFEGTFTIDSLDSVSTIDNINLELESGEFIVDGIDSLSTIENINITLEGDFQIGEVNSQSTIDNIELSQASGELVISGLESTSSIEEITLTFEGDFLIDPLASASLIDNVDLEQESGELYPDESDSTSSIDNITIEFSGGTFTVSDLDSNTSIENIDLSVVRGFDYNKNLIIDSIGGKCIELGNSRINTWNTDGRPTGKLGIIGFNTETSALEVYNGTGWVSTALS